MLRSPRARASARRAAGTAVILTAVLVALLVAAPGASPARASPVLEARALPGSHASASEDLAVAIIGPALRGSAPFTVHLGVNVTGGTGAYSVYAWDLGDGQTAYGPHLTYTFRDQGNYTVQLSVTDNIGDWGRAGVVVVVVAAAAPPPPPVYGSLWFDALLAGGAVVATFAASLLLMRSSRRREGSPLGPAGRRGPSAPSSTVRPGPAGPTAPSTVARVAGETPAGVLVSGNSPGNGNTASAADALRLSQKIIVHLGRQGMLQPGEVATMERTQVGLSKRFGASQSSVSNLLQRLAAAGVVSSDSRHVAGHPRRLRVYALTSYGQEIARDLRAKAMPTRPAGSFLPPVTATLPPVPPAANASGPGNGPRTDRSVRTNESGSEGVA